MRTVAASAIAFGVFLLFVASCATTPGVGTTEAAGGAAAAVGGGETNRESETMTIEPSQVTGMWQGMLKAGPQELRIVFHFEFQDGVYSATMDSPDQGAKGIPVDSVAVEGRTIRADMTPMAAYYEGTLTEDGTTVVGTFNQAGSSFPMDLSRIESVAVVTRPQDPVPPFPYDAQEVRFRNQEAGITLAGTLTVPAGPGPFPAVVLVTGSGAQNRDEELFNHRPFLVLADYLTRAGIAVLRFDDRGVPPSEGDASTATSVDLAGDAWAAFSFLVTQPKVDSSQVGIAGHSEGGIIAPMVAGAHPEVGFIVLMAGPGFRGYDLVLQQSAAILRASGASEDQITQAAALNRSLYDIVLSQPDGEKARAELEKIMAATGMPTEQYEAQIDGLISPWYRHFLAFDPATALRRTTCPVLAVGGSKDLQVPAIENLAAIERAVREGGNTQVTTVELDGLNHLFQHATTGLVQEYGQIEETFAPVAMETIADWILEVTRGK